MGRLQKVKGFPTDGRKRHSAFPHQSESLQHFFDRKTSARQTETFASAMKAVFQLSEIQNEFLGNHRNGECLANRFTPETGTAQGKRGAAHQPG
ncbi:hypothetical protein [Bilophila wadsworthia]|jgi:hypothetical protein|uniref:hypothetical protein n=1 Tax=Bilophila wadsworthia TaxID=35833 RepID=UPI0026764567|nr:hypothetical protein [Bilophila wadsworthia]